MIRRLSKRIVISFFLLYILDVCFSFFTNTESILMQTVYGLARFSIGIYLLFSCQFYDKGMMLIRNVTIAYAVGSIIMYLYAFIFYHDADVITWGNSVNNYYVMVPIYTGSILGGILHTAWTNM